MPDINTWSESETDFFIELISFAEAVAMQSKMLYLTRCWKDQYDYSRGCFLSELMQLFWLLAARCPSELT